MAESGVSSASWKQRPEGGTRFAIGLLVAIGRKGGRGLARLFLYPIAAYFVLLRGPERRASRAWLSRVAGEPVGLWGAARHIHAFSATILDRLFLLGGQMQRFDIRVHGLAAVESLLDQNRGALLFGSHLGSFDALRALSKRRPGLVVRVVLDRGQNPVLTELFDSLDPQLAKAIIDGTRPGAEIALEIQAALESGQLVAMLVDRAQPHEDTVAVPFCGQLAPFPLTPWRLAAVLRAPVLLCFGLYRGGNRYDLHFEPFLEPAVQAQAGHRAGRAERVAGQVAGYAARLEEHARQAPLNWFNFYDFWNDDGQASPSAPPSRHPVTGVVAGLQPGPGVDQR